MILFFSFLQQTKKIVLVFSFLKVPYHNLILTFLNLFCQPFTEIYMISSEIFFLRISCTCIIIAKNYDLLKKIMIFWPFELFEIHVAKNLESHKSFMLPLSIVICYQDLFIWKPAFAVFLVHVITKFFCLFMYIRVCTCHGLCKYTCISIDLQFGFHFLGVRLIEKVGVYVNFCVQGIWNSLNKFWSLIS